MRLPAPAVVAGVIKRLAAGSRVGRPGGQTRNATAETALVPGVGHRGHLHHLGTAGSDQQPAGTLLSWHTVPPSGPVPARGRTVPRLTAGRRQRGPAGRVNTAPSQRALHD